MNRPFLAILLTATFSAALTAQQPSLGSYQGTSNPPADDAITADQEPQSKPPAAHPMVQPQTMDPAPIQQPAIRQAPQPSSVDPSGNYPAADTGAASLPPPAYAPALGSRSADPDGDIVHPRALQPGELGEGTTIRVHLLDRLSTTMSEKGEPFRSTVANDVLQGGQVLIPAGAEIDGTVVAVSSGHVGSSGSMRLRPETVVLADGSRFRLYAETTGTPGSRTHVVGEGNIRPNSRWKRNGIEYGGAVGAGVVAGAFLGGPIGALAGGAIGAGAITAHLMVSHPQATLEPGSTLLFTLTEPLMMTAPSATGN